MRQVRRVEQKRDDPLIDEALEGLRAASQRREGQSARSTDLFQPGETASRSKPPKHADLNDPAALDEATVAREAKRVLRRLSEQGACLAVAMDMEKAVVVRDLPDGRTMRTAVLDRGVAQAIALKGWIAPQVKGKITRYSMTAAGRSALRAFLAADESARAGFAEAPAGFDGALPWGGAEALDRGTPKRIRYSAPESPVMMLARRRDKDGSMFLAPELVAAAERVREDFELAQMGGYGREAWEAVVRGEDRGPWGDPNGFGPDPARARVCMVLNDLGPGLAEVVLRCCCYLDGMEQTESQLGWSARSGKIVLRIALQRLARHYERAGYSNLIG
ncbi:DUF6456 domain-containing protein [Celeribacter sp.]|uniref:DUF6456 domain-containing protein n=1 Tax=Celeribacter sp. TaxID=1890673 RepID=UPI003A907D58